MKKLTVMTLMVATIGLTACGNTRGERALSGAGIGAGAGAVGTALTGGNPWAGAAIGGLAGGAVGAITNKDQVNLDK